MKIVSWNIARRDEPWRWLLDMDADIALLQEARPPPADVAGRVEVDPADWVTAGPEPMRKWRAAVVRLSDRVTVEWIEGKPVAEAGYGDLADQRARHARSGANYPSWRGGASHRVDVRSVVKSPLLDGERLDFRGRFGAPDCLGPVGLHRPTIGPSPARCRRPEYPARLRRVRQLLLGGALRVRVWADGGLGTGLYWAAGPARAAGGSVAI